MPKSPETLVLNCRLDGEAYDCTLSDALVAWGAHEAKGRCREYNVDPTDRAACLDLVLWFRAGVIQGILARQPARSHLVVELLPEFALQIRLFDGRSIDDWIARVTADRNVDYRKYQALVDQTEQLEGRLLLGTRFHNGAMQLPFVLYDGWHRSAAWLTRSREGRSTPIEAYLICMAH